MLVNDERAKGWIGGSDAQYYVKDEDEKKHKTSRKQRGRGR